MQIAKSIKKLTRGQKKIISLGIIILFSFFACWVFVYQPQSRKLRALKNNLRDTRLEIAQITSIAKGSDLASAFLGLERDLAGAVSKFPPDDQDVIYLLSESAKKLNLELKSITPGNMQALENRIPGYEVLELPILMNLFCELRTLGEYLIFLRETCPLLVSLRHLDIQGKGEGQVDLDVALQLSAYLSKKVESRE